MLSGPRHAGFLAEPSPAPKAWMSPPTCFRGPVCHGMKAGLAGPESIPPVRALFTGAGELDVPPSPLQPKQLAQRLQQRVPAGLRLRVRLFLQRTDRPVQEAVLQQVERPLEGRAVSF